MFTPNVDSNNCVTITHPDSMNMMDDEDEDEDDDDDEDAMIIRIQYLNLGTP